MTLIDLLRRLFARPRRPHPPRSIVRIVPLADVPKTVHFNHFCPTGLTKSQFLATPPRRNTLSTTQPTTQPAVTLTNDQAFSLIFSGGSTDAEGYPTGAATAAPAIAILNPDGTPETTPSAVVFGFDGASPLTCWLKRAAFVTGDTGTVSRIAQATFADGVIELTPFTFDPGASVGEGETEGQVVPLSAVPTTVIWPTPAAA
jgi:hypothetical protein